VRSQGVPMSDRKHKIHTFLWYATEAEEAAR
jgi:hypothetical protein